MKYSRREILKCLAAGGVIVAGELWIPGARKIFISSAAPSSEYVEIYVDAGYVGRSDGSILRPYTSMSDVAKSYVSYRGVRINIKSGAELVLRPKVIFDEPWGSEDVPVLFQGYASEAGDGGVASIVSQRFI